MRGPMLQTLLEERFNLKIHHDDTECPGLRISCRQRRTQAYGFHGRTPALRSNSSIPMAQPSPGQRPPCGPFGPEAERRNRHIRRDVKSLCAQFSAAVDRDVIDKTGLTGRFDIHLALTQQELFPWEGAHRHRRRWRAPIPVDSTSAIMAAVLKLGLRLRAGPGPRSAPRNRSHRAAFGELSSTFRRARVWVCHRKVRV